MKCEVWSKIFKVFCAEEKYRDEETFKETSRTKKDIRVSFKEVHCNLDHGFSKWCPRPIARGSVK